MGFAKGLPRWLLWDHMSGMHRGGQHGGWQGRGRPGPPPWAGFGGPPPWGRGGRGRARRGDVRAAILALLAEGPRNGYGLMQEIEARSHGVWRPSPGSVYPALAQLEDEGLVRAEERDGKRTFSLTEAGQAYVQERAEELQDPWDAVSSTIGDDQWQLWDVARQVGMAVFQISSAGTPAQQAAARDVLTETRRALYGLLAEDAPERGEA